MRDPMELLLVAGAGALPALVLRLPHPTPLPPLWAPPSWHHQLAVVGQHGELKWILPATSKAKFRHD